MSLRNASKRTILDCSRWENVSELLGQPILHYLSILCARSLISLVICLHCKFDYVGQHVASRCGRTEKLCNLASLFTYFSSFCWRQSSHRISVLFLVITVRFVGFEFAVVGGRNMMWAH